jgi:hypothetical protein
MPSSKQLGPIEMSINHIDKIMVTANSKGLRYKSFCHSKNVYLHVSGL